VPTLQSSSPLNTPNLSSERTVISAASFPLFVTTYVNSTSPPVSGTVETPAVLRTEMSGNTSV